MLQAHISQLIYHGDELPQVLIDGRHAGVAPAASRRPVLEPTSSANTHALVYVSVPYLFLCVKQAPVFLRMICMSALVPVVRMTRHRAESSATVSASPEMGFPKAQ